MSEPRLTEEELAALCAIQGDPTRFSAYHDELLERLHAEHAQLTRENELLRALRNEAEMRVRPDERVHYERSKARREIEAFDREHGR